MTINWYPGHMVKAKREIEKNLGLVDIVIMLLDARAPFSCRNSELEMMVRRKKVILVLNKKDLAASAATREHLNRLRQEGYQAVAVDSSSGRGAKGVIRLIREVYAKNAAVMQDKGRRVRPARVMVVGIPNVGKSTFINSLLGKKIARTGEKPGVTRGQQWLRIRPDIEFLDTPGLMWPKIEHAEQGFKLALLNIVGENAYQEYEAALFLIKVLKEKAPRFLQEKFDTDPSGQEEEIINDIARKKGHLQKGGELDIDKTSQVLLQEFRRGELGRLSLD